jgi:hypothetical protein
MPEAAMTDLLPRRPYVELVAPPDGASTAVRGGRRIRRRRRLAGAGAAVVSVAVVAGVVTGLAGGANNATDQLIPAVAPSEAAVASPATSSVPARATTALRPKPEAAAGTKGVPAIVAPGARAGQAGHSTAQGNRASAGPSSGYSSPALRRSYEPPIPTGARVCSASYTAGVPGQTHKRIDWCVTATSVASQRGHDLTMRVCRDQTTDATLSFAKDQEADLEVRHAGRVVWRWSTGRTATSNAHALATPAGACWVWTAPWTDVDATGRPLGSGSYDLVVTSRADQLADLPTATTTFKVP